MKAMIDLHLRAPEHREPGPHSLALALIVGRYRVLLDGTADALIIVDGGGRGIAANVAAETLLGYRGDEWLALDLSELVALGIGGVDRMGDRVRSGSGAELATVRRKDRVLLTVNLWTTVVADPAGDAFFVFLRPAGAVGDRAPEAANTASVDDTVASGRETRALHEARETVADANRALRESEDRFRGAFAGAPIGMALVAPEGRFLQVNPSLLDIVGYSEDELLALTFQEISHPDDLADDLKLVADVLAGTIDTYQIEKRYLRKDGRTICGRLTVSLVRDATGAPLYFISQIQDITPYKAAGAALREAEARYRSLVEQIPAVVYVDAGDALGTPLYVSPQIEALLGYTPAEWISDAAIWWQALHPDDRERMTAAIAGAGETETPMHLEYRFLARDGREVWVHDQAGLVRDEEGLPQYWQGFIVDVTDRKRAEEALRSAKEAAEEASRLKSAFLSMATHELRTPLTVISGYVELLFASASAHLSPEEREYLEIAQTGARTLASLVDDLLDLARMEAGRLDVVIRPVDVAAAIDRVHRLVAAQAEAKGLALEVTVAPEIPAVMADLNRLVQVLLNILGNAIKFTERGGVRIDVSRVAESVEIRVADTGIGIAPDALPRIFDEFRQADAGTTRRFGGSGLGLAIAKRLIEMQGGRISVASAVGAGSTFTVSLPIAVDPGEEGVAG